MKEEITMNKMGVVPVPKLLLAMGLPMMVSMAMQAVYNIVDSYFVSCMKDTPQISGMGDYAVNALTLAFPVQMLMVAVTVGTGVGINALLSKSLGENNRKKASEIAGNSIFLGICTYAVFLLFGITGVGIYLRSQTADPVVLKLGSAYLGICTVFSLGSAMYITYEKLLQATGRTMLTTIAQIAGAVTNIILDPVLIFGLGGFPEMGIEGAAYATVIGQFVSCMLDGIFHYRLNRRDLDTHISYMRPQRVIIKEIYQVGIPAILMQALMSFMTYGVNIILGAVSITAVTAYGVYYKIQQFVLFAAFGMNNAMIPVIGFNYGKRDQKRVRDGIKFGMLYMLVIMGTGAVGLQIFASSVTGIFAVSQETREMCIQAIRLITPGYLFVGANIAFQGIFQSLGRGISSLVISLLRLIVIALPLAWIFTKLPGMQRMIWIAFPIAEAGAFAAALVIMKHVWVKKLSTMGADRRGEIRYED